MLDISTINIIARFFLGFSNLWFIIPMLLLGLIFFNRNLCYHALCLMFLSILINIALKIMFQIPLNPDLHKIGFAFPSGHMQLSTIVYGWLALKIPSARLRVLIGVILIGVGCGLVYFGYHTGLDVLGGVFFASLLIAFYAFMQDAHNKLLPWILLSISSFAMFYITWKSTIWPHTWVAYATLLTLVFPQILWMKRKPC